MEISRVPALRDDVPVAGSCNLDDTVGTPCIAAGVVIGVVVNIALHRQTPPLS
jgi:hypothetical protein